MLNINPAIKLDLIWSDIKCKNCKKFAQLYRATAFYYRREFL